MLALLKFVAALELVIIIGFVGFWQRDSIIGWMKSEHLLPEPEPLTELYFEDHTKLPNRYLEGDTKYFNFTIHNLEYREVAYIWYATLSTYDPEKVSTKSGEIIYGDNIASTKLLASGAAILKHDQFKTASQSVSLKDIYGRVKITIELVQKIALEKLDIARKFNDKKQSIHIWMDGPKDPNIDIDTLEKL